MKNKIEKLIEDLHYTKNSKDKRNILTSFAKEIAVIDRELFPNIYNTAPLMTLNEAISTYNAKIIAKLEQAEQPSPNWWENLKGGELVMTKHLGNIREVDNWFREELGEKRVFITIIKGSEVIPYLAESYTLYNPTADEAVKDLKEGKITPEQFKKVYKP